MRIVMTFPACDHIALEDERNRTRMELVGKLAGWLEEQAPSSETLTRPFYKSAGSHFTRRISAVRVVGSKHHHQGTNAAMSLLSHYMAEGRKLDYVLFARHDIALNAPISTWPTNFSNTLLEKEALMCCRPVNKTPGHVCGCGARLDYIPPPGKTCEDRCSTDHLFWFPRRHLKQLESHFQTRGSNFGGHSMYGVIRKANVRPEEIEYMFPPDCDRRTGFFMTVACDEASAYRPRRFGKLPGDGQSKFAMGRRRLMEETSLWRL